MEILSADYHSSDYKRAVLPLLVAGVFSVIWGIGFSGEHYWLHFPSSGQLVVEAILQFFALALQIWLITWKFQARPVQKTLLSTLILAEPLLGFLIPGFARVIFFVTGTLGVILTIALTAKAGKAAAFVLCFLIPIAFFLFIWLNSDISAHTGIYVPVFHPELARAGVLHKDILYQSSLSAMVKNYGVVSTGINGVSPVATHFFSNYWFAGNALMYDTSALLAHGIFKLLVVAPLILFCFINLALFRNQESSQYRILVISGLAFALEAVVLSWRSLYMSETFALAALIFIVSLPAFLEEPVSESSASSCFKCTFVWLLWIALPLLAAAGLKLQVGIMLGVFVAGYCMRQLKTWPLRLFLGIVTGSVLFFLLHLFLPGSVGSVLQRFHPFSFRVVFPRTSILYICSIVAILYLAKGSGPGRRTSELSLALTGILVAAAYVLINGVPDGNCHYFSYPMFLTAVFLLVSHHEALERCAAGLGRGIGAYYGTLPNTGSVLLVVVCSAPVFFWLRDHLSLLELLNRTRTSEHVKTVSEIESQLRPFVSRSRSYLVYVPPGNDAYWNLVEVCTSKPFFVPSLLEVPRIQGIPPKKICQFNSKGYGFKSFQDARSGTDLSDAELCQKASEFHFQAVLELTCREGAKASVREIRCPRRC